MYLKFFRVLNFTETASKTVAARAGQREHRVSVSWGQSFSQGRQKKSSGDDGDGCTTMWMYLALHGYVSKDG